MAKQKLGQELRSELGVELMKPTLYSAILTKLQSGELTKQELATALSIDKISGYMNRTIQKQLDKTLIERTIPDTPNHPAQKFKLTERGKMFLELLANAK